MNKLKEFRNKVDINDIDLSFIHAYKKFLIEHKRNIPITWNKALSILKRFINFAIDKDIIKKNPFEKFKLQTHHGKREHLIIKELNILDNLRTSEKLNKNDKITLDYFLFACNTGLRYTDVKNLKHKNIKNNIVSINMHKTGLPVSIPLNNKSKKYIEKSNLSNKKVFNVACNQVTNKRLKKIMNIAGIDKKISFHCARHTLATVGVSVGIPIEVISSILGHTEIRTTQIYAKIGNELKSRELEKME